MNIISLHLTQMAVIFSEDGLKDILAPPCVLQQFVNHNATLYKVMSFFDVWSLQIGWQSALTKYSSKNVTFCLDIACEMYTLLVDLQNFHSLSAAMPEVVIVFSAQVFVAGNNHYIVQRPSLKNFYAPKGMYVYYP